MLAAHYACSENARIATELDRLTEFDVDESILSDVSASEVLRTTNIQQRREG
ncbi:hypothetical protein COMA1_20529 [Candidatus Nitrospira nitrosa]|uniref:Uncharacterized protein n=1 Tax=Candidatus Nitrospira nitrosa TaxID=1742972 RepID=A0A0S4LE98_9BACT|nr:hypothetical protein COMA1_20529 [Candidatus Nitrospira nitrosa]